MEVDIFSQGPFSPSKPDLASANSLTIEREELVSLGLTSRVIKTAFIWENIDPKCIPLSGADSIAGAKSTVPIPEIQEFQPFWVFSKKVSSEVFSPAP